MSRRNRLPPWHEQFTLVNGQSLLIRPIRIEDTEPIFSAFSMYGPESLKFHFLQPTKELTIEMVGRLASPNPKTEFVLVAAEPLPAGKALVGAIAHATMLSESNEARYTILVSQFLAGMGVGRKLMCKFVKWAKCQYIDRLGSKVSRDNTPMLELAKSLGFKCRSENDDTELIDIVLELGPQPTLHSQSLPP
ncbi:MAG: GNAT family N-acetyltransferase [Xanthomonadaceae bacterium]|nr:GNAT family N-acetyltransferase [Xanthomonadaceae bacterium]